MSTKSMPLSAITSALSGESVMVQAPSSFSPAFNRAFRLAVTPMLPFLDARPYRPGQAPSTARDPSLDMALRLRGAQLWLPPQDGPHPIALLLALSPVLGVAGDTQVCFRPDPCRLCALCLAQHGCLAPGADRGAVRPVAGQL